MASHLILGGARSGKSRFVLSQLAQHPSPVHFIATAEASDAEMAARIARHQQERPPAWYTTEAPLDLLGALKASTSDCVIVDCLTLWLSNWLCQHGETAAEAAMQALLHYVPSAPQTLYFVSNEVGLGLVPTSALGRQFRDLAGWLHQALAKDAQSVVLMVAGLPLYLKRNGQLCGLNAAQNP